MPQNLQELLDNWPGANVPILGSPVTPATPGIITDPGAVTDSGPSLGEVIWNAIDPWGILGSPYPTTTSAGTPVQSAVSSGATAFGASFGKLFGAAVLLGVGYLIFVSETRRRT